MIHKVGEPVVIVILRQIEDRRQFNKKGKHHKKKKNVTKVVPLFRPTTIYI